MPGWDAVRVTDQNDEPDVRLQTAVHESGHAIIAERAGMPVLSIVMRDDLNGETTLAGEDPATGETAVKIAVAGFAAVGVLLDDAAEAEQRARDGHLLPGCDLEMAIRGATEAGAAPEELHDWIAQREAAVRDLLRHPPTWWAVKRIAEQLWGDAQQVSGEYIRFVIDDCDVNAAPLPDP
jgi:hypothetical protein